ncbi:SDR family oxidoreductase [Microbulbifer thermotolerans]|uniref:SDR family oxidoreductase n=1 Tax=Microbulbifer thermotolerans TaxID=252514 RepID=A0A143HKC1_MICTH|nr:SDR family oxidoreductase [Microbulbifer thermotolerans]AMX02175.1 short-chain dehydrogenase [Microbulbifer thermotolerans]MCX2778857.1 SDR family oxidoreductase [Microbulbifer thermotolerans]MCX2784333.1 SDR family oxidoreductase [Microbulbifer thermotolerans]MCX2793743.1 SDR family oxidoreductase [Microbulbifer thermotolerans]MCX2800927.1 SDR family oxidoreductase [Microbulbifer thermotolerans]
MSGTILITGSNRGIGLEVSRQFASEGWRVLACCRDLSNADLLRALSEQYANVRLLPLDVTDHQAVAALGRTLQDESIDILLNNAGYYGPKGVGFGNVDFDEWRRVLETNTIAPYVMAETFADKVAASGRRVIAVLSSKVGSIADNTSGGGYIYRSSKTAVNQVVKSLSIDLRDRGISVIALHPGWVKTAMGGPNALISVEESAAGLKRVLLNASLENSGRFINYDGSEIPW